MTPAGIHQRRPVNVLTGFLGSGKTTLLRRVLRDDGMARCAVLINELGSVGLDHFLVEETDQDMVVLPNGCVCCAIRGDLENALLDLLERHSKQAIPDFDRLLIETTGVADPAPIINTILASPVLQYHFRVGTLVTVVDAVHGLQQLARQDVSQRQVAVADRMVISKADIAPADAVSTLRDYLSTINAAASIVVSHNDVDEASLKLSQDVERSGDEEVPTWFVRASAPARDGAATGQVFSNIGSRLRRVGASHEYSTLSLVCTEPIDWIAFGVWLSMLLHRYGEQILRVKGLMHVQDSDTPVVVHGVQTLIHPPAHLQEWPDGQRVSRLVLIGALPPTQQILDSLDAFSVSTASFTIVDD